MLSHHLLYQQEQVKLIHSHIFNIGLNDNFVSFEHLGHLNVGKDVFSNSFSFWCSFFK